MAKKKTEPKQDAAIDPRMPQSSWKTPSNHNWEYIRVEPEGESLVDTMNVYGLAGWEAVSVDGYRAEAYLKRQRGGF